MKNKLLTLALLPFMLTACPKKDDGGNGNNNTDKKEKDKYTLLIYMCGSDLESDGYAASKDISEMLSVTNQPKDVNIVIETGGARKWKSTYGISSSVLTRFHIENGQLVEDEQIRNASMGKSTTLQSFLEYGINNYPADKMALVYWNHGDAMNGCCFDENFSDDSLTNDECLEAYENAWKNTGFKGKMEWVGYDACLMQVQDIADYNSKYFNYMVASQELENEGGWEYNGWIDDLYAGKDTVTLLKEISNTFVASSDNSRWGNDQTMSVLDLSKMDAYRSSWEAMTSSLVKIVDTSAKFSAFKKVMNKAGRFGYDEESIKYNEGYISDVFDVKSFIAAVKNNSTYSSMNNVLEDLSNKLNDLVIYSKAGKDTFEANGLCFYCPVSGANYSTSYDAEKTAFNGWRDFSVEYGKFYSGRY